MSNATTQLEAAATGGAIIVDWVLNGSQIKPADLRVLVAKHGFDASVVPDIDQVEAVRRIARNWRQTRAGYSSKVLKDEETVSELVISVRKDKPGQRRNDALQFALLTWDKVNDQWAPVQWDGTPTPEAADAVKALVAKCDSERLHLDCDFIRPVLIQGPLKAMGSVSFIRSSGGAQVVPAAYEADVDRICDLVSSIGDCYMGTAHADLAKPRTVQTMQRSVERSIMAEVVKARDDLKTWRDRGTRLPTGSIGSRISQFKALRDQVEMYAGCLQMRVDDLMADLAEAEADAKDLLDVAMGRKDAADAAPVQVAS